MSRILWNRFYRHYGAHHFISLLRSDWLTLAYFLQCYQLLKSINPASSFYDLFIFSHKCIKMRFWLCMLIKNKLILRRETLFRNVNTFNEVFIRPGVFLPLYWYLQPAGIGGWLGLVLIFFCIIKKV